MAVVGDVMIKMSVDVADVKKGMSDVKDQLGQVNKSLDDFSSVVKKAFDFASVAAWVKVIEEAFQAMAEYVRGLEKASLEVIKNADAVKLTTDAYQAYAAAALHAGIESSSFFSTITKFNSVFDSAIQGSSKVIDNFSKFGITLVDLDGNIKRPSETLAEMAAAVLRIQDPVARARAEFASFGDYGADLEKKLTALITPVTQLQDQFKNQIIPEDTLKSIQQMSINSEEAGKKVDVFFTAIWNLVKSSTLQAMALGLSYITDNFRALGKAIADFDLPKLAAILYKLSPAGMLQAGAQAAAGAVFGETLDRANKELESAQASLDNYLKVVGDRADKATLDSFNRKVAAAKDYVARMQQINSAAAADEEAKARTIKPGQPDPYGLFTTLPDPKPGSQPSATDATGKGAKGGAAPRDRIEEQIKRLTESTAAANKAITDMASQTDRPLDDLKNEVERQKKIDDMIAQLTKSPAGEARRKEITATVTAYVDANNALQQYEKYSQAAENRDKTAGDGTKQRALALRELDKEMATGRLSNDAYAKSLYDINQQYAAQQEQIARIKGGMEGFEAGIESAARAYQKSHDEFSTGQQAFTGLVDAMSQGLDTLSGASTKTFDQIAADFARMLAKLALQAAASQVFKAIFGTLTTATDPLAGIGNAAAQAAVNSAGTVLIPKASGGPVSPDGSYLVGENGPERFVPGVAGMIQPNGSGGGDITVNVSMGQVQGATGDPSQALAFGRKMKSAVLDIIQNEQRPGGTLYTRMG